MTKTRLLAATAAFSLFTLAACEMASTNEQAGNAAAAAAEADGLAKLARIDMNVDTSFLSAEEREVVNLLNQAAELMSEIYRRQATPGYDRLRAEVAAKNDAALLEKFDAFFGPWDPIEDGKPWGPVELAWSWELPPDRFSPFISGAERLANGNTLVCAGADGILLEVSAAGEIVWEYRNPYTGDVRLADGSFPNATIGSFPYAVFRATRISPDHPGLAGRKLEPLDPQPPWALPPAPAR